MKEGLPEVKEDKEANAKRGQKILGLSYADIVPYGAEYLTTKWCDVPGMGEMHVHFFLCDIDKDGAVIYPPAPEEQAKKETIF